MPSGNICVRASGLNPSDKTAPRPPPPPTMYRNHCIPMKSQWAEAEFLRAAQQKI